MTDNDSLNCSLSALKSNPLEAFQVIEKIGIIKPYLTDIITLIRRRKEFHSLQSSKQNHRSTYCDKSCPNSTKLSLYQRP